MKQQNLSLFIKTVKSSLKKHSPEILTGIGIAGMITTVVVSVKVTPKALMLLDEETHSRIKNNLQDENENIEGLVKVSDDKHGEYGHYRLPVKDILKVSWKLYIPSVIIGSASVACLIGASSVNFRRNAALATAYSLSESAYREYREKIIDTIGPKKEQSVRDEIMKEKVQKQNIADKEVIITGKGETLCYDSISGRCFKADIDKIRKSVNELNRRMLNEMYISLNDFYYEIGLDTTKLGDDLGWHIDDGLIELSYGSVLIDGETPCLVIDYKVTPRYDYQNR